MKINGIKWYKIEQNKKPVRSLPEMINRYTLEILPRLHIHMQSQRPLAKYDSQKTVKAIRMLLTDRSNEFREVAYGIGYPTTTKGWEEFVLNFCLDFSDCFKAWSDSTIPPDHHQIHKCMTQMRQIANGKTNMIEVTKIQNVAYTIAEEFKHIYNRIS